MSAVISSAGREKPGIPKSGKPSRMRARTSSADRIRADGVVMTSGPRSPPRPSAPWQPPQRSWKCVNPSAISWAGSAKGDCPTARAGMPTDSRSRSHRGAEIAGAERFSITPIVESPRRTVPNERTRPDSHPKSSAIAALPRSRTPRRIKRGSRSSPSTAERGSPFVARNQPGRAKPTGPAGNHAGLALHWFQDDLYWN